MVEECFCCGAFAPRWDDDEYADWVLELAPDGTYLGVICAGCYAGEGLAFLDAQPEEPVLVELPRRTGRRDDLPAAA